MCKRALKFYSNILCSTNKLVSLCGRLALGGSLSNGSNSVTYIAQKCKHELFKNPERYTKLLVSHETPEKLLRTASDSKDVVWLIESGTTEFTSDEIELMLECVCVS